MANQNHLKVDKLMKEQGLDILLLTGNSFDHPSFTYLVGGEKLENAVLVYKRQGKKILFGSDLERDNGARTGFDFVPFSATAMGKLAKKHHGDPGAFTREWLIWCLKKARAKGKVAIYGSIPLERAVTWLPRFKQGLGAAGLQLVTEKVPVLQMARELKSEVEIARIALAGRGTFTAFEAVRKTLGRCHAQRKKLYTAKGAPLTIGDLKREIRLALTRHDLTEATPSICAQGAESGVPHNAGTDSHHVVSGQPIIVDIFPRLPDGYFFDMTRTFCPGKAPRALKRMYQDIKETTILAYEMFEPGMKIWELHMRASRLLSERGYETLQTHPGTQVGFCHGLGHGLGLEVHEEPFMRATSDKVLTPGMVFTIEPGVYYPERKMGVRIEDVAVVREGHLECLTDYPMVLEVPLKE
jgi:Xaa-Pro aminopeptidase